jgi:ATP-dependent DNA helicase 2 subunit 2
MVTDRKTDRVADALSQMATLIERFVRNSLRGDLYPKALECLREMRAACVKEDEGGRYNEFLHRVKKIFGRGTTYGEFFNLLAADGQLSLITHRESPTSSIVTDEEARAFMVVEKEAVAEAKKPAVVQDDLMDEIE